MHSIADFKIELISSGLPPNWLEISYHAKLQIAYNRLKRYALTARQIDLVINRVDTDLKNNRFNRAIGSRISSEVIEHLRKIR